MIRTTVSATEADGLATMRPPTWQAAQSERLDWMVRYYSPVYTTGVGELTAAEICDAIKNATTTAGTLISLRT